MNKKLIYTVFAIIISNFIGCYTVLTHPDVELVGNEGTVYSSGINYYDDCSSCHSDLQDVNVENMNVYDVVKAHLKDDGENDVYDNRDFFGYFSSGFYVDYYDYYYNTPWWTQYTPVIKSKERENYRSGARDNDSERSATTERRRSSGFVAPTVTTTSSSSGSGSSTSSSSSSTDSNNSVKRTSSDDSSSRNSSDAPSSRNSDGSRSSDSGRRR